MYPVFPSQRITLNQINLFLDFVYTVFNLSMLLFYFQIVLRFFLIMIACNLPIEEYFKLEMNKKMSRNGFNNLTFGLF